MALSDDQVARAAELAGTPLYAYSAPALRTRVTELRASLPDAEFVYSLKANPNLSIVRCLTGTGTGTEVCSLFELETSLSAGVPPERTIFVGPAKSAEEIGRAVSVGVKAIIAESLDELALIDRTAASMNRVQPVALRLNPSFHVPGARLSMSGKPTQFGLDEDQLSDAIAICADAGHIRLAGLHVYMGTRILDHNVVAENTRHILALAEKVSALAKKRLEFVDIGGGYGVPYSADEAPLDLPALADAINPMIADWKARHPGSRIVIELGRYMVAEAGVFATRVRYVKQSKGQRFAVCDGGSNVHGAAGQAAGFRRNFPIAAVHRRAGTPPLEWTISGPLCTPTDVIGQKVSLPPLAPGDLVRIDRSGAYGMTASPVQFLSFASPAEVLVDGDTYTSIRAPGTLSAHLAQFAPVPLEPSAAMAPAPAAIPETAEV